jgi:hypothetical protein
VEVLPSWTSTFDEVVRNPGAVAETTYEPGLSSGNRKLPESFVIVGCSTPPVPEFCSVTVAAETTAPDGSATIPLTAPVTIVWERTGAELTESKAKPATSTYTVRIFAMGSSL